MSDEVLELSLTRKEKKLKLDGTEYTLREMVGTQRDQWMNQMGGRMRTDAAGKTVGVKDFTGLHSSLICKCLYGSDNTLVAEKDIQNWPASVQAKVFEECQRLNALGDEKTQEEAKND